MKYKIKSAGYTIVEVLIVASISAIIGVSAFTMVSNQQENGEFNQAVRDFETKLVDVANDVSSGYFPRNPSYPLCEADATNPLKFSTSETVGASASPTCIFGGKIVEFNPTSTKNTFNLHTLAVRKFIRNSDNIQQVTSLDQLADNDLALAKTSLAAGDFFVTENKNLLYGLEVVKVSHDSSDVAAIVYLSSFSRSKTTSPTKLVGAPVANLNWFHDTSGEPIKDLAKNPTKFRDLTYLVPSGEQKPIVICVRQGGNGRVALISLGIEGRQLTTATEVDPPNDGGTLCTP